MLDSSYFLNDSFESEEYFQRLAKPVSITRRKRIEILGPEKNQEGKEMARICFALSNKRWPKEETELLDYEKEVTKGHRESISTIYRFEVEENLGEEFTEKSPYLLKGVVEGFLKAYKIRN